jgi:hypothetical protein
MLNTTPFTSLAGTVWIEIDAGANVSGNVDLLDMGTLDFEFDLMPSDKEVTSLGGIPGGMTISIGDKTDKRVSAYDAIADSLGNYNGLSFIDIPKAKATLYIVNRSNQEYRVPFEFRLSDISIDEISQKTTIRLSQRTSNLNVKTWASGTATNNFPTPLPYRTNAKNFNESWAVGDFIYDILSELDTGSGNSTLYRSGDISVFQNSNEVAFATTADLNNYLNSYVNFASNINCLEFPVFCNIINAEGVGITAFAFVQDDDQEFANANSVLSKVQTFAGMEGAIFGSAFNVNYYINRTINSVNINLSNADLSELKFSLQDRDINDVAVTYTNTNIVDKETNTNIGNGFLHFNNTTVIFNGWAAGSRTLNIDISGYYPQLNKGRYTNASNVINGDFVSIVDGLDEVLIASKAAQAYSQATGAFVTNTAQYKVDLDILGVNKIKPWEVIRFNETVPSRYWGKHFRPTSLSYDLKADRVRVTAYEIDTFEFTPPVPPPPQGDINIKACENGTYMVSLVYATNATADPVYTNDNGNYMLFSVYATNATGDPVYSNENGNYMVESFTGTNTMISAQSETNGTATDFTATL